MRTMQNNLKLVDAPHVPNGATGAKLYTRSTSVLLSWTGRLAETFEREIRALQFEQQEREFFATSHGCSYGSGETRAFMRRKPEEETG